MANTFREQAEDRFTRSLAFMSKAESLLQDDLVNRSALADAVSAIKNMLQGYVLLRVSETPPSAVTQRWQEIAASNSMPDLLHCCGDAGLNLAGLAFDIRQLNKERNQRMHDDPVRHIDAQQAKKALELARAVQKRIKGAVRGEAVAESATQPAAVQRIAAVTRAAVSGRLGRDLLKSVTAAPAPAAPVPPTSTGGQLTAQPDNPLPTDDTDRTVSDAGSGSSFPPRQVGGREVSDPILPAPVTPTVEASEAVAVPDVAPAQVPSDEPSSPSVLATRATSARDDALLEGGDSDGDGDGDSSADTTGLDEVVSLSRRTPRRFVSGLLRGLVAAALLVAGVVVGAGLTVPVMEGHAPPWLAFASNMLPAEPTATPVIPTATAAPVPQNGPLFAGAFMVDTPACSGAGKLTLALHNAGTMPAMWAAGSPDGSAVSFALKAGSKGAPTLAGTLAAGGSATLYVANASGSAYHVVVVAPDGTIQLLARAC